MQNVSGARRPDDTATGASREELTAVQSPLREAVLATVAHQLRKPLHAICTASVLLLDGEELPEHAYLLLAEIERAADRMVEMLGSLVDFTESRRAGTMRIVPVPADLGSVCCDAIDELLATTPDRSVELHVQGDVRGTWDPARLERAVSNLVMNAVQHGSMDGRVRVSVRGGDDHVELGVQNDGPVVPEERLAAIFESFGAESRSHDSSPGRGLGLGLYMVKAIVSALRGVVSVRSTREHGTVFTVRLPRSSDGRA